jgi:hypothetical protein
MADHDRLATRCPALVLALLLTACGGGGGGGGSSTPVEYLEITSGNARDVAGTVIQTVASSFDLADAGGGGITAGAADAAPGAGTLDAGRYLALLPRLRRQVLAVGPLASVGPVTEPCLEGGSITVSGNVADPDTLSVGDRITAVFNDCDDGDGAVADGRLELVIRALQGDPLTEIFLLRTAVTVTRFAITEGGETTSADGDFELTLDSLDFPQVLTRITGDSLELAYGGDTYTLTNFDETIDTRVDLLPYQELVTAVGTLASRVLGGKVDYVTTVPVEGPSGDAPEAGEILITGLDGATIRVVVQGQSSVELRLDLDGNGSVDEVQATTWAELGGAVAPGVTAGNAALVARESLAAVFAFETVVRDAGLQFDLYGAFRVATDNVSVPGPFGPVTPRCQLSGGSASVSGQLAVPGTFAVGDDFTGTFIDCYQQAPIGQFPFVTVLNGVLAAGVTDFVGSVSPSLFTVSFAAGATDFHGANGQFSGTYTGDPMSDSWAGASPGMQLAGATSPRAVVDASVDTTNNTFFSPARITRTVGAGVYTAQIPGFYLLETLTPLVSNGDSDLATGPYSGEVRVTADNGTSVRVVAVSDLNARLDLDLDGNGSIDQSITVPWQQLLSF